MGNEPEPGNPHLEWNYEKEEKKHYAVNTDDEVVGFFHLRQPIKT